MDLAIVVYEHTAALIGQRPWTASREAGLMAAHSETVRRYGQRHAVLGIDIYNLEAEALGAGIDEPAGDAVPAITRHILPDPEALSGLALPDWAHAGRFPLLIDAAGILRRRHPGLGLGLPLSGPFSLATGLCGLEPLLCALMEDPDRLRRGLEHLTDGLLELADALRPHADRLVVCESAAAPPLVPPSLFTNVVRPPLARLIAGLTQRFRMARHRSWWKLLS